MKELIISPLHHPDHRISFLNGGSFWGDTIQVTRTNLAAKFGEPTSYESKDGKATNEYDFVVDLEGSQLAFYIYEWKGSGELGVFHIGAHSKEDSLKAKTLITNILTK